MFINEVHFLHVTDFWFDQVRKFIVQASHSNYQIVHWILHRDGLNLEEGNSISTFPFTWLIERLQNTDKCIQIY